MTVANSDQENKNQNTYYHPDPRLDGWTFMSISPVDSVSEPLLGKTIVNKKPEPKPITTEANTDSRKRSYDARFPFGQSQEIDALITKNNKKRPQTNLHTTNHDNSRSNATNALNTTQSSQGNTDSSRSMPQPSQETRRVLPESHNATLRGRVMPQSLNTTPSRIIAPKTLASVTRHITPKRNINDSKKTYSVFNPELYNTLSDEQKRIHDLIVNNKQSVFFSGSAGNNKQ
jgi:hypothetical protein